MSTRKWGLFLFNLPKRYQNCTAEFPFTYKQDLPKNLSKTTAQRCKKPTSGWGALTYATQKTSFLKFPIIYLQKLGIFGFFFTINHWCLSSPVPKHSLLIALLFVWSLGKGGERVFLSMTESQWQNSLRNWFADWNFPRSEDAKLSSTPKSRKCATPFW